MNRLTKKVSKIEAMLDYGSEYIPSENCHSEFELYDKLGKLEDIEEELGIDLITYFKLKPYEIIYVKFDENDKDVLAFPIYEIDVENKFVSIILDECDTGEYLFKDYGKTWALTREVLENES